MTTDCHINYLVLGSSEVREKQVANGRLYENLILTYCVNFNLTVMISAVCGSNGTLRNILEMIYYPLLSGSINKGTVYMFMMNMT